MNLIRIRKIIHNKHCEYIGSFECDEIGTFFKTFSCKWLMEHVNAEGVLDNNDIGKLIESSDEFNLLESDYFLIGYPVTHQYEGMLDNCSSILIENEDEYGFETVLNDSGTKLTYKHVKETKT